SPLSNGPLLLDPLSSFALPSRMGTSDGKKAPPPTVPTVAPPPTVLSLTTPPTTVVSGSTPSPPVTPGKSPQATVAATGTDQKIGTLNETNSAYSPLPPKEKNRLKRRGVSRKSRRLKRRQSKQKKAKSRARKAMRKLKRKSRDGDIVSANEPTSVKEENHSDEVHENEDEGHLAAMLDNCRTPTGFDSIALDESSTDPSETSKSSSLRDTQYDYTYNNKLQMEPTQEETSENSSADAQQSPNIVSYLIQNPV
ncbi:hypothetical protein PFISCL1PPCAC_11060, partial [Pristionchus fissidentatus]